MKITELKIDELDDFTGFTGVGLVESPAHESPFYAFNEKDALDLIAFELLKQGIQDEFSQEFSNFNDLPSTIQEELLEKLSLTGISIESLESEGYELIDEEDYIKAKEFNKLPRVNSAKPDRPTSEMKGKFKVLYQYRNAGGSSATTVNNSRDFCRKVVSMGKLWRKEDVDQMSFTGVNGDFAQAGSTTYDILKFAGGENCRHEWKKVFAMQKPTEMSSQKITKQSFAIDGDNQMVVGPLIIPDKLILRVDEEGDPYFVYFSRETTVQIANKMMRSKLLDQVNLEHDPEQPVSSYMVESWIITDKENDKSNAYGFDLPLNTWMGMYKIEDPEVWKKVKNGEIKGFSIEGFLNQRNVQS
jgi:hypothetical protein